MHGLKLHAWKIQNIVRKRKAVEIVCLISHMNGNYHPDNEI